MKQLYVIKKQDSHKKVGGTFKHQDHESILQVIEANNRTQALTLYSNNTGLGKGYHKDPRKLVAVRKNHNKKRRVERITVSKLGVTKAGLQKVNGLEYVGLYPIKKHDGGLNQNLVNYQDVSFIDTKNNKAVSLRVKKEHAGDILTILGISNKTNKAIVNL